MPSFKLLIRSVVALLLTTIVVACTQEDAQQSVQADRAATALETLELKSVTVPRELAFDGVIEALNQAVVSAQTSGRIVELPFDVGDYVPKGALIARFTDTEQQAALAAARARLEEARAHLLESQQQFERITDVYQKGLVAKAEYDRVTTAQQAAAARVESAKAALEEANERLSHTRVVAPYSGILVKRLTDVGATVSPGTPLLEGLSLDHLRVRVNIPQQHIGPLRQHKKARVLLDTGASISVNDMRISPSADIATNSFPVLLTLPEVQQEPALYSGVLFPGTLVKVAFVIAEQSALLLPKSAIAYRGEVTAVYVVDSNHHVEFRYIRLGQAVDDEHLVVLAGLSEGEKIIVDPVAGAQAYKTGRGE